MLKNKKLKKAFTLVEMMIVIIIIGILMAALLPKLQWAQQRARDVARKANLSTINTALLMYFNDQGTYPTWSCMNDTQVKSALVPSYLSSIPKDPQGWRITSWTKAGGCTDWVYAYSSLTKNWARQWGAVVVANIEAYGNVANWVLTGTTEFNSGAEYESYGTTTWLNEKICSNWVFQSGDDAECGPSRTKWYVSVNRKMVYAIFN